MSYFDDVLQVIERASHLGCKQLPDGTRLIGPVPHVAPQAYLHAVFAGLNDAAIDRVESLIRRTVPAPLRGLFQQANGLSMFSDSLSVYGLRERAGRSMDAAWQPYSIETPNIHERPPAASPELVFFATYNWDGSEVGISESNGEIIRCARETGRALTTWPSLSKMLISEAKRLARLFDKQGRELPGAVTAPS